MGKIQHSHQHNRGQNQKEEYPHGPYWKRVHHHWYFWVGMLLMLMAIGTYIMTEDLAWLPSSQSPQPLSSTAGK